ncbi:MAG: hypothetical protein IJ785_02500 [Bacteroidales bacterium]|nr:hypothetical protein [Bacteroidales bacterium]
MKRQARADCKGTNGAATNQRRRADDGRTGRPQPLKAASPALPQARTLREPQTERNPHTHKRHGGQGRGG